MSKLDDLYEKHEQSYDEYEKYINYLLRIKVLGKSHADRLLILTDEVVETHAYYSYELGRIHVVNWIRNIFMSRKKTKSKMTKRETREFGKKIRSIFHKHDELSANKSNSEE